MDRIVDPPNLRMSAIQTCNLAGQVPFFDVSSELPIELLVAFSPGDKS